MPKKNALQRQVMDAIAAAEEKKAEDVTVLELDKASGGFTDFFVICSGGNPRQVQAISDEVEQRLSRAGLRPTHVEGYKQAEWVLLDYVDFVVHVFSQKARHFYNLERLWKSAKQWNPAELRSQPRKRSRARTSAPAPGRAPRSHPRARKA
jgi:ribosome-associated protein